MKKVLVVLAILGLCVGSFAATHVFWAKATTNAYNLQDNAGGKGPGLAAGVVVHEGNMATGTLAQHSGANADQFVCGSGLDDAQGRCGWFWAKDLCDASGTITSAKFRAEYRDGWCGNALCNSGPVAINRGVVDFQGNLDFWGGADMVDGAANWKDDANLIGSFMGYNIMDPTIKAGDTLNYTAPTGSDGIASVLDGQFMEVDCTPQVQWILQNTVAAGNPSALSGQYAVVFLVTPGMGSTGKINSYTQENGPGGVTTGCFSDAPWTTDGNTGHIVVEGDLVVGVEKAAAKVALSGIALAQNVPNPFVPKTTIAYNTDNRNGSIKIYDANGKLVHSQNVSGKGSIEWNAGNMVSGIYAYRLTVGNKVISKKMILMK